MTKHKSLSELGNIHVEGDRWRQLNVHLFIPGKDMTSISDPVLIVIDDLNLCQYVSSALKGAGFTTIITSSI